MKNLIVPSDHNPVVIAGRRRKAVLAAQEDGNAIQETLYLVSIPGMRGSIKKGLESSIEKCDKELDW